MMGKVLDLSVFREPTLDILMADGAKLRIPKPTQAMVIEIVKLRDLSEDTPVDAVFDALDALVWRILNSNLDGIRFARADIAALTPDAKTAIVNAYSEFAAELQANPTSRRRTGPENRPAATKS